MSVVATLKKVSFLNHLTDDQLARLVEMGDVETAVVDQLIYQQGEDANSMHVILAGQVRIYKHDDDGNEVELARLDEGDFFGELALMDNKPRSANIVCLMPCTLFVLERASFEALVMASGPELIYKIFSALTTRMRETTERFFNEELNNQNVQSQAKIERLRALGQMVAGVAHELNTPLGLANSTIDLINNRLKLPLVEELLGQDEEGEEILDDILEAAAMTQRNLKRAHKLIDNFKKISVTQLTDTRETVDLPTLVADIVDLFKIQARRSKVKVIVEDNLPEGSKTWVGYPGYLTQVLLNLLTNAERYAYPAEVWGDVVVGLAVDEHSPHFVVTVQDFGHGISVENVSRIFEPFFTTGRGKGGTGLGLAIIYNLVTTALEGEIEVQSTEGEGTLFTVTVPQEVAS